MNFEGIIATPFGYLIDGIYRLVGDYGLTMILFAIIVQSIMVPINLKTKKDAAIKRRLKPLIENIREEYKGDIDKQADLISKLYKTEKISLLGGFILAILPFFVLIPIFQVIAQPITYMFHESKDTANMIIQIMYEQNAEWFPGSYNQVAAMAHIHECADLIRASGIEVSERTLQGLSYDFLGIDMSVVLGTHVIGNGVWAWDWAHIGALLLPVVYMSRRIIKLFGGMIRYLVDYTKRKKRAKKLCMTMPKAPKPPLLGLWFLFLSVTAMATVPVVMDLYWLSGSLFATFFGKLLTKLRGEKATAEVNAGYTESS